MPQPRDSLAVQAATEALSILDYRLSITITSVLGYTSSQSALTGVISKSVSTYFTYFTGIADVSVPRLRYDVLPGLP